jgi:hypothetical protein
VLDRTTRSQEGAERREATRPSGSPAREARVEAAGIEPASAVAPDERLQA